MWRPGVNLMLLLGSFVLSSMRQGLLLERGLPALGILLSLAPPCLSFVSSQLTPESDLCLSCTETTVGCHTHVALVSVLGPGTVLLILEQSTLL